MASTVAPDVNYEQDLRDRLAEFRWDPLGAVRYGFPWGEGDLAAVKEPRKWQCEELDRLGAHLRNPDTRYTLYPHPISSGHGPGKTTFAAMVSWWCLSTFLDAMGRATANTERQLSTVMQPEFSRWFRRAINAHWFDVGVTAIKAADPMHKDTWRIDLMPWSLDNPQAFAGKHNALRRMLYLFEEAAPIPLEIFRVARGAMTDAMTEKIFLVISNPILNNGAFYEAVFGNNRDRWTVPETFDPMRKIFLPAYPARIIDSRDVEGCDLAEINGWLKECEGNEDTDYFRVRARGLFPVGGSGQFIDLKMITDAQRAQKFSLESDPLIAGVDFARGGEDDNVVRMRKGYDARSFPKLTVKGEFTRNPEVMIGKLSDVLGRTYNGETIDYMFVDASGVGGHAGKIVAKLRSLGFQNIIEVNFGDEAFDSKHYAYRRDEMWGRMKEWLQEGGAIDKDPGLAADLGKPMLMSDREQRIKLEPKDIMKARLRKMGIDATSPDDADALALTFAQKVVKKPKPASSRSSSGTKRRSAWN